MSARGGNDRDAFLFVYGTLLTVARCAMGADMRARLRPTSTSLGGATTAGRLVNLGAYPAMIEAAAPSDAVDGEVLRLDDPDAVFVWLDPYEGIIPGDKSGGEYERLKVPVRLANGETLIAWVYLYRGDASRAPVIATGRWIA